MTERGVSEDQVRHAIEFPDKLGRSLLNHARFLIKKIYYHPAFAKRHLLMVVYEEKVDNVLIITIIDTSKIEKYF